jgi:electron transfer flavoprotein alpha subunit
MPILLIAEHNNSNLKVFTLNAITAASKIDKEIHVLVAGNKCESVSKEVATIPLVKKVLYCDSSNYENFLAENLTPLIVKLSEFYSHIIASANTFGKNFMPRVAAILDVSQISDVIKINSAEEFLRPIYAGNAFATIKSNDKKNVLLLDPLLSMQRQLLADLHLLKILNQLMYQIFQNLLKEKKQNLKDLNWELQEL